MDHRTTDLELRFSEAAIRAAVRRVAAEISHDLRDHDLVLVGVLTGAFVFLADLVRELAVPAEVDFLRASSYGAGMSSGPVQIACEVRADLTDRHVVVVEDIADTGRTLAVVLDHLRAKHPASLRTCALLARHGVARPDYLGMRVGPGFVVGYGIDHAGRYRGLRDIRVVPAS